MEPAMTTEVKADNYESVLDKCQKDADIALDALNRLLSVEVGEEKEPGFSNFLSRLQKLRASLQAVRSRVEDVESRVGLPL